MSRVTTPAIRLGKLRRYGIPIMKLDIDRKVEPCILSTDVGYRFFLRMLVNLRLEQTNVPVVGITFRNYTYSTVSCGFSQLVLEGPGGTGRDRVGRNSSKAIQSDPKRSKAIQKPPSGPAGAQPPPTACEKACMLHENCCSHGWLAGADERPAIHTTTRHTSHKR